MSVRVKRRNKEAKQRRRNEMYKLVANFRSADKIRNDKDTSQERKRLYRFDEKEINQIMSWLTKRKRMNANE